MRFRTRARGGSGGGGGSPSLSLDFLNSVYSDTTSGGYASLTDYLTASSGSFTRSGDNAWYFNSAGTLTQATANVPRFDYDPSTLAFHGLLMEGARTNSAPKNSDLSGFAAGTPGTVDATWQISTSANGITRQIVGTGTSDGIEYVRLRLSGTASASFGIVVSGMQPAAITASATQVWTSSVFARLHAGSVTTGGIAHRIRWGLANGNLVAFTGTTTALTTASLRTQRWRYTDTAPATTERGQGYFVVIIANGEVVDMTIDVGLWQFEIGSFASSPIKTTGTAVTRNADVSYASADWLSPSAGSLKARIRTAIQTSGFNFATLHNATDNDESIALRNNSSSIAALTVTDGGVSQADFTNHTAHSASTARSVFAAWADNDFALSSAGTAVTTDTSGTVPTGLTRLQIGDNRAGTAPFFGHVQKIEGYGSRLSNTQLQAGSAS